MALYRQLKFPSTFIEYRSVSEWKGVVVNSNFDSLEAALGGCLVCLGLNTPLGKCCIPSSCLPCGLTLYLYWVKFVGNQVTEVACPHTRSCCTI